MHLALLGMLWRGAVLDESFAYGKADMPGSARLTVHLVNAESAQPDNRTLHSGDVQADVLNALAPADNEKKSADTTASLPQPASGGYYSVGQLTRLPSPVASIDLNDPVFNGIGFTGTIELTISIRSNGIVSEVVASSSGNDARAFAELVAARFRKARFLPGEINGAAVNSQLRVTVVSDPLPATEERQ